MEYKFQKLELKSYLTKSGAEVLYIGQPNLKMLDQLVEGPGDLFQSSLKAMNNAIIALNIDWTLEICTRKN